MAEQVRCPINDLRIFVLLLEYRTHNRIDYPDLLRERLRLRDYTF